MIESKNISLLIPRLPDRVRKCFCTPDGAMDPTFQIKYIPSKFVFNLMEIMIIKQIPLFFETPCIFSFPPHFSTDHCELPYYATKTCLGEPSEKTVPNCG